VARAVTTVAGGDSIAADLAVAAGVTRRGDTVEHALAALLAHEGPGVVVLNSDGRVTGVLTSGALLAGARRVPRRA